MAATQKYPLPMSRLALMLFLLAAAAAGARAQVAVIVNESVNVESLSRREVMRIYSYEERGWPGDMPIVVVTLKERDHAAREFYGWLGKKQLDMNKLWLRLQLSGEGKPPYSYGTEEEAAAKVRATPGAIGFVSGVNVPQGVKVVAIIQ